MSYEINYTISFNNDCESPLISTEGFFEEQGNGSIINPNPEDGVEITEVKIEYFKQLCDGGCNNTQTATSSLTITNFEEAPVFPTGWSFADEVLTIVSTGPGVNGLKITITYKLGEVPIGDDDRIVVVKEYTRCVLNDCGIICCILSKLAEDIETQYLVNLITGIVHATTCNQCCLACDLYNRLSDRLKKEKCKPCK